MHYQREAAQLLLRITLRILDLHVTLAEYCHVRSIQSVPVGFGIMFLMMR